MKRSIGPERHLEIITDLADAALDIRGLTEKYGVDREDLARWALTEKTQRTLLGLCLLADYQTQLMLSHYRVTAVSRLVEMVQPPRADDAEKADESDSGGRKKKRPALDPDVVRKACVDLLRLNMGGMDAATTTGEAEPFSAARVAEMRKVLYGDPKPDAESQDAKPQDAKPQDAKPQATPDTQTQGTPNASS